jgi:hypothetical protein
LAWAAVFGAYIAAPNADSAAKTVKWVLVAISAAGLFLSVAWAPFGSRSRRLHGDSDDVDQSFRSHADQIGAKRRRALSV